MRNDLSQEHIPSPEIKLILHHNIKLSVDIGYFFRVDRVKSLCSTASDFHVLSGGSQDFY